MKIKWDATVFRFLLHRQTSFISSHLSFLFELMSSNEFVYDYCFGSGRLRFNDHYEQMYKHDFPIVTILTHDHFLDQ
jgi:hypothetical protein